MTNGSCKIRQGIKACIYQVVGEYCIGVGRGDKNGMHTRVAAELHITQFIAHHNAFRKVDLRKIFFCLQRHAWVGFPVWTVVMHVSAEINLIDTPAMTCNLFHHKGVYIMKVLNRHQAFRDSTLVGGDHNNTKPRGKYFDGFLYTVHKNKFCRIQYVLSLFFNVDHTIPVEE